MSSLSKLAECSLESGLGSDNYLAWLNLYGSLSPASEVSVGGEFLVEPPIVVGQAQALKFGGWVVILIFFSLEPTEALGGSQASLGQLEGQSEPWSLSPTLSREFGGAYL